MEINIVTHNLFFKSYFDTILNPEIYIESKRNNELDFLEKHQEFQNSFVSLLSDFKDDHSFKYQLGIFNDEGLNINGRFVVFSKNADSREEIFDLWSSADAYIQNQGLKRSYKQDFETYEIIDNSLVVSLHLSIIA